MERQPYCDECGKVIDNYFTCVYGDDIANALRERYTKKCNGFRELFLTILAHSFPLGRLLFCCQKHKDRFAKECGLKKRILNSNSVRGKE